MDADEKPAQFSGCAEGCCVCNQVGGLRNCRIVNLPGVGSIKKDEVFPIHPERNGGDRMTGHWKQFHSSAANHFCRNRSLFLPISLQIHGYVPDLHTSRRSLQDEFQIKIRQSTWNGTSESIRTETDSIHSDPFRLESYIFSILMTMKQYGEPAPDIIRTIEDNILQLSLK
ncbi:MAG TPA: hypothetical protein DE060_07000 [Lentisphaeria bacterium]|nr:hypothetical protein [Lentisphaeria bacterium]HCG48938.1 hypothetical protein [Lentisphaeria bacterium]